MTSERWDFLEPQWGLLRDQRVSARATQQGDSYSEAARFFCDALCVPFPSSFAARMKLSQVRDAIELVLLQARVDPAAFSESMREYLVVRGPRKDGRKLTWVDVELCDVESLSVAVRVENDDVHVLAQFISHVPVTQQSSAYLETRARVVAMAEQQSALQPFPVEATFSIHRVASTVLEIATRLEAEVKLERSSGRHIPFGWTTIKVGEDWRDSELLTLLLDTGRVRLVVEDASLMGELTDSDATKISDEAAQDKDSTSGMEIEDEDNEEEEGSEKGEGVGEGDEDTEDRDDDSLTHWAATNKQLPLLRARDLLRQLDFFNEWLRHRDVVTLLSTCTTLRRDRWTATNVLRENGYAAMFKSNCEGDWCAVPPTIFLELDRLPGRYWDENDEESMWHRSSTYLLEDRDRRLKLLSLVGLMRRQLVRHCCKFSSAGVDKFHALPCLLLTDLPPNPPDEMVREQLEQLHQGRGDLFFAEDEEFSSVGVHWENMTAKNGTIHCEFCDTVEREVAAYLEASHAYHERRAVLLEQLEHRLIHNDGMNRFKAYEEARKQLDESMQESDEFYERHLIEFDAGDHNGYQSGGVVEQLYYHKKMPLLNRMVDCQPDDYSVLSGMRTAASGVSKPWFFCNKLLRPIRQFFERNGFTCVRRVQMPRNSYYSSLREYSVDWIGGVSPTGFLAGVYVVETTT